MSSEPLLGLGTRTLDTIPTTSPSHEDISNYFATKSLLSRMRMFTTDVLSSMLLLSSPGENDPLPPHSDDILMRAI